jgi:hypothetical protein
MREQEIGRWGKDEVSRTLLTMDKPLELVERIETMVMRFGDSAPTEKLV